jgi:hypothetical protein
MNSLVVYHPAENRDADWDTVTEDLPARQVHDYGRVSQNIPSNPAASSATENAFENWVSWSLAKYYNRFAPYTEPDFTAIPSQGSSGFLFGCSFKALWSNPAATQFDSGALPVATEFANRLFPTIKSNQPMTESKTRRAFYIPGGISMNYPWAGTLQVLREWKRAANELGNESVRKAELLETDKVSNQLLNEDEILVFRGDPDDKDFVPCSKATVERAKEFLSAYASARVKKSFLPKVLPGPHGSIDIHWKNKKRELLVNIPADPEKPATFYGDDFGAVNIHGSARIGEIEELIACWLES